MTTAAMKNGSVDDDDVDSDNTNNNVNNVDDDNDDIVIIMYYLTKNGKKNSDFTRVVVAISGKRRFLGNFHSAMKIFHPELSRRRLIESLGEPGNRKHFAKIKLLRNLRPRKPKFSSLYPAFT